MAIELKPCPFCGAQAEIIKRGNSICYYAAKCLSCRAEAKGSTELNATVVWNQRSVNGETSDGYHTFNELYHHRAVLFSKICNAHQDIAWKSKKHDDGTMYYGYFVVGIETPEGQATYHYDAVPYWNMFNVKELDHAPKWDGHTPEESIRRIGLLC